MFTPVFTPRDRSRCEQRCEHLRHGPNLMSDRTSGAWSACSLDALTAWKRPEPTKWAVVVIFCARVTNRENEVCFRPKLASRARAPSLTTTAHFVGSGCFQAVSSSREHALHAPHVRSDIRSGMWRRCDLLSGFHAYCGLGTQVMRYNSVGDIARQEDGGSSGKWGG